MRTFAALFFAALLLAGCGSAETTKDVSGELLLEQELLEFPRTYVGYPTSADLVLRNTGRTEIPVELAITGPYTMRSGREKAEGGEVLRLPVSFKPRRAGTFTGVVTLRFSGAEHEVELLGRAEDPPACTPSAPCRKVEFDPDSGTCVESIMRDFTTCDSGNACQTAEVCRDGVCVGIPRHCGDDDVCTADACDPATGCIHVDRSAECPEPASPCKVPVCDPEDGCGFADAPDATPCGPSDCRTAFICIGGSCDEVETPDGTPCTDTCGEGSCQAGECERPLGDRLEQLWSYAPEEGRTITFPGISDGAGQLYWIESDVQAGSELVSATPGGVIRYASPLEVQGPVEERGVVLEGELILVAARAEAVVEAHLSRDGSSPWSRSLQSRLEDQVQACPCTLEGASLTRSREGRVAFAAAVTAAGGGEATHTFVAMLRSGSGEVAWSAALGGALASPPVADEEGNLYLLVVHAAEDTLAEMLPPAELLSLDPEGAERWRVPATPEALPLLVWDGALLHAADVLRSTVDGAILDGLGFAAAHAAAPLRGAAGSWAFTGAADGNVVARSFDEAGAPLVAAPIFRAAEMGPSGPVWGEPILTRRDTALLSATVADPAGGVRALLVELEPDGERKRTCTLGLDVPVVGNASLRAGRWVVEARRQGFPELRAYELPHGDPAAHGWVGPLGNPAGGGRPQ